MLKLLRALPKAALSRAAGRVARWPGSRVLIGPFARHYGVDRAAAVVPAEGYASLQAFFCRELRPGTRPIASEPGALVSPVDGRVGECGRIERGQLLQAKGRSYSLAALLEDEAMAARFLGGLYCTLYLAPGDYHRIHAPTAGTVSEARYVPGEQWPVNPQAVAAIPELFITNERLITYLDGEAGRIGVVKVGACLVGAIRVNYDPGWNGGRGPHPASHRRYTPAAAFARGQELGRFEFGSTVVVVAEAAGELAVAAGARVRMGEMLARSSRQ